MRRAVVLLVLTACGRLGFDEIDPLSDPLTAELRVVAGATSIDLEVCASRAAGVRAVVSTATWPVGWDAAYFDTQPGVVAANEVELTDAGCTTLTEEVTLVEAELHVYTLTEVASTAESVPLEATATLSPMLSPVSMAVAGGHTQRYWIHYPEAYYRDPAAPLPVLVVLAGQGENGDDAGTNFMTLLSRGMLAPLEQRRASVVGLPFLVISPQCNTDRGAGCWGSQEPFIDEVLAHARSSTVFDDDRIYVTGFSTGGEGALRFAMHSRSRAAGSPGVVIAAAVPIASTLSSAAFWMANVCRLMDVAVWAFHNSDDSTQSVMNSRNYVQWLNACPPRVPAQLDEGLGNHNAWSTVYNDTHAYMNGGASSIFTWLLAHTR